MDVKPPGWKKPHKVNAAWQYRFELFDHIRADSLSLPAAQKTPQYWSLPFKDRQKLFFNFWGLLAGPLYYLYKRMWFKACALIGAGLALAFILLCLESWTETPAPYVLYWIPLTMLCSYLAGYDYYRMLTRGETIWRFLPTCCSSPIGALLMLIAPLSLVIILKIYLQSPLP